MPIIQALYANGQVPPTATKQQLTDAYGYFTTKLLEDLRNTTTTAKEARAWRLHRVQQRRRKLLRILNVIRSARYQALIQLTPGWERSSECLNELQQQLRGGPLHALAAA